MKVIGWTGWDDPRYPEDDLNEPMPVFEERRQATIEELRKRNYHLDGFYHQGGELGVPVFDDGGWLRVTYRTWGQIMADAFPRETGGDSMSYVVWAWHFSDDKGAMNLPKKEDYPDYVFWDQTNVVNREPI